MKTSLTKVPRIEGVDALRGFAVMAIVLVHNLEHFIFSVYPTRPRLGCRYSTKACLQASLLFLPAKRMPSSPCCLDLRFIFKAITSGYEGRISDTASSGD